jgi:type II secretory pathway component PulJ
MKTKAKLRKGLTLIELSIAIATSAIVVLATGAVVVFGQRSWNDTLKKANLQRDASYAMLRMTQSVKKATNANVDANDAVLTLTVDGQNVTYSYLEDTNDLQYETDDQTEDIINGKVESLQFYAPGDGTVKITLGLKEDNVETQFESTVMMRNSGG